MVSIKLTLLEGARAPERNEGDAGWDCFINGFCTFDKDGRHDLKVKEYNLCEGHIIGAPLGFKSEIPKDYYAQVVPRSGLAAKYGLTITNSPGTIDSTYRGEWVALLTCCDKHSSPIHLKVGDKICQFMLRREIKTEITIVGFLEESERGENGFGSTGE